MHYERVLLRAIVCVAILFGLTCGAYAGIGACRDHKGRFVGTRWQVPEVKGSIWSDFNGDSPRFAMLNPQGDENGDLWPSVVESSLDPHHPWVVWSRFNGKDYDLAWARWRGARWTMIRDVHRDFAPGDDLDADMNFDDKGRPYLVWWRNEKGVGRVFLSVFLNSRWMAEIQISELSMSSSHPTVEVIDDGQVLIEYETPRGLYAQVVKLHRPETITDDINPFSIVELIGEAVMVQRRP